MTEKRYYEKDYDELYYIFDSKTLLAYLNKCGSENVEAVNNAMDIDEYFDEEIDTLK